MTRVLWDQVGARLFETGIDLGILYVPDETGAYNNGYAWNGLISVSESPIGAEASPLYADNLKYLNLVSVEEFSATIEAFTYPDEFLQFDGTLEPEPGVLIGQQSRGTFGLVYHTRIGNDVEGDTLGYKIHLIYGALVAPTEKSYGTVNESPEAITFSWELTTTPIIIPGYKPSAHVVIDSTKMNAIDLDALQDILYGTSEEDPRLPLINEILTMFSGGLLTESDDLIIAENDDVIFKG